jgi:hypothetical protein
VDTSSASRSDFYVELMRDSRGLGPEHAEARERWFDDLEVPDKEDRLFELEVLLKGLVCFGDPNNQPGPRLRETAVTREYGEELRVVLAGCERVAELCRILTGDREDSGLFAQPLRRVQRDHLKERLLREPVDQASPEASLRLLASSFSDISSLAEALTGLDRTPYQVIVAIGRLLGREIERNVFFNPLVQLEFRPEIDRITNVDLLEIVYGTRPPGAKRAVTLTFLALLRLVRYLDAGIRYLADPPRARVVYLPLAAVVSDGRALTRFLARDARNWLSEGFEQDLMSLRARELPDDLPRLRADFELLNRLGSALHTTGDRLHLELRRIFERELVSLESPSATEERLARTEAAMLRLSGFLRSCIVTVGRVFDTELSGPRIFAAYPSSGDDAERLRLDAWMFTQILRGFLAKAEAAPAAVDRWTASASYRFVQEFIIYFRNFGARVVRALDYADLDGFTARLETVAASDVDCPEELEDFVEASRGLHAFLLHAFEELSAGPELAPRSFDRREAAETLRLYLDR